MDDLLVNVECDKKYLTNLKTRKKFILYVGTKLGYNREEKYLRLSSYRLSYPQQFKEIPSVYLYYSPPMGLKELLKALEQLSEVEKLSHIKNVFNELWAGQ